MKATSMPVSGIMLLRLLGKVAVIDTRSTAIVACVEALLATCALLMSSEFEVLCSHACQKEQLIKHRSILLLQRAMRACASPPGAWCVAHRRSELCSAGGF